MFSDKDVTGLLEAMHLQAHAMQNQASSLAELATGLKVNGVLWSGTVVIGAKTSRTIETRANFASATVRPAGADVTITNGGEFDRAPTQGAGTFLIPGDIERTVAIAGNNLVIYGTPGTLVAVTLWVRPQPPASSESHPLGVDCPNGPLRVPSSATSELVLAANPFRRGATFYNDSSATLYLAFAATAGLTAYTIQISSQGYYELPVPIYRGVVSGIWSLANGAVQVTELQ